MNYYLLYLIFALQICSIQSKRRRLRYQVDSSFSDDFSNIHWDSLTDSQLLQHINYAEKHTKIFIYPRPAMPPLFADSIEFDLLPHFKTEYLFRKYLVDLQINSFGLSDSDSRRLMVVNDPSQANAFLIDHDWIRYTRKHCDIVFDKHLVPIIDNVVDNYPYYNRSGGKDHFFLAVFDNGPFCEAQCDNKGNKNIFKRIMNASFIGNYGMDRESFRDKDVTCHRAGLDVVIPQLLQPPSYTTFYRFNKSRISYREYDSTFSGSEWGDRAPLRPMWETSLIDYKYNHTENYTAYLNGSPDLSLKYRGYFMYSPCGFACWSQRTYEALAHYTIPILISDGAIQPFEKFLDWTKFSVKMVLKTWFNDSLRTIYRQQMRKASDEYRFKLRACWKSLNMSIPPLIGNYRFDYIDKYPLPNDSWVDYIYQYPSSICHEVSQTTIWKKQSAILRALPWFDMTDLRQEIHAFRLLSYEIWCRITTDFNSSTYRYCQRPSDYTARKEYF